MQTMADRFRQYVGCFRAGGVEVGGSVFGLGANAPGDVRGTDAMRQARELGKGV